jgi:hypothetical protein
VSVNERDYLGGRGSSSRAKKADAAFKISFARRSSRFSRSSSRNRARSSVVNPGRSPASVSARRTQIRNVSWLMLSFAEIDSIAFHCDGYSSWCSSTNRTARSRTSSGYLPTRLPSGTAPSSQGLEQSPNPGRFNYHNTTRPHRALGRRTPPDAYQTRPKATPRGIAITDGHYRVRQDRVCDSGTITLRYHSRLHHIGLGRPHAGQRVLILTHDRHIRVLTEDGQLLRDLTLDPTHNYQPQPKT